MSATEDATKTMRTVRYHNYGEPTDVVKLEEADIPTPGAEQIRIAVYACALNPADWALCRGMFPGSLPRGVGFDVSGTVDAIGDGVTGVRVGDLVLGVPDWAGCSSAGLADYAVLTHWAPVPNGLDLIAAASLTMVVETTIRSLDNLKVEAGHTLMVNGAGTMVGFAAVQVARMRGARVIATAGETLAERLRALGATVTPYGEGMVERVRDLAGGSPDLVLDTSPPGGGVLPDLVKIADGDPKRVLTITDHEAAKELGVRNTFGEDATIRYDALAPFAELAAEGKFTVPVARTFPMENWREAMDVSLSGHAHGKLVILLAGKSTEE